MGLLIFTNAWKCLRTNIACTADLLLFLLPLVFPIDLRAKVNCTVAHNWFFLTRDTGQDLVLSAKFLLGKDSQFFSLTPLILF